MSSTESSTKVPLEIANMTMEGETELPLTQPAMATDGSPKVKKTKKKPKKKRNKSALPPQDSENPDKRTPSTPARYAPLIRVLHHLLLATSTLPEAQWKSDPTLAYLKILSNIHLSDLNKILAEDDQTDWLAHNAKRTEVLIAFVGLNAQKIAGTFGAGHVMRVAEAELDTWFEDMNNAIEGEWDPERKGRELGEVVGKIRALDKAGKDKTPTKPVAVRRGKDDPPPSEPQTWQHKERAIAASKRLQAMMFGDSPITPMKGKIEFGPPIRQTR